MKLFAKAVVGDRLAARVVVVKSAEGKYRKICFNAWGRMLVLRIVPKFSARRDESWWVWLTRVDGHIRGPVDPEKALAFLLRKEPP